MAITRIQEVVTSSATATLGAAPTAGNLLVLGIAAKGTTSVIAAPTGFTATGPTTNLTPDLGWYERLFYKVSDGTETSVTPTVAGATASSKHYAEYSANGATLDLAAEYSPGNVNTFGNFSPTYPLFIPTAGTEVLCIGLWELSSDAHGTGVTMNEAPDATVVNALVNTGFLTSFLVQRIIPVTSGGYRLSGVLGASNFSCSMLAVFAVIMASGTGLGSLTNTAIANRNATASVVGAASLTGAVVSIAVSAGQITAAGSLINTATPGPATPIDITLPGPPSLFGFQARPAIVPAGAPAYPWTLFRGAAIGVKADRDAGFLRLALDLEDYNRQFPLMHVGVALPNGVGYEQPDGTIRWVDPNALNYGIGPGDGGVVKHFVTAYWPTAPYTPSPDLSGVQNTNPDYSGLPIFDRRTSDSDFAAIVGEFIRQRGSPASRYWVAPDGDGLDMNYRIVGLFDGLLDQRVAAPFAFSTEGKAGTLFANINPDWDWHKLRRRVRVRGGTPASCVYVENPLAPTNAGDAYADAPGAITRDEGLAVGEWHLKYTYREFMTATIRPLPEPGKDGYRVGQSTLISDLLVEQFEDHPLDDYECVIRRFGWDLPVPSASISIRTDLDDLSNLVVAWEHLSGEETLGSPGKATIVVYLWDPEATISVRKLADVKIWLTAPTDALQYTIEAGDMAVGDLLVQMRDNTRLVIPKASYKFVSHIEDKQMPPGGSSPVWSTIALANFKPEELSGVPCLWLLFAWADEAETIPSDEYTLDDEEATTNTSGQIYTVIQRAATTTTGTVKFWVEPVALAIPP